MITFKVRVSKQVRAALDSKHTPIKVRRRASQEIVLLEYNPCPAHAKPLTKDWKGHYRIRIGDWRLVYRVMENIVTVMAVKLAHRKEVY